MISVKDVDFIFNGIAYWFMPNDGNSYSKGKYFKADVLKNKLMFKRVTKKVEYEQIKELVENEKINLL